MQANQKILFLFFGLLVAYLCVGCSSVNVLRLTAETYSPRSVEEVAILSEAPPHGPHAMRHRLLEPEHLRSARRQVNRIEVA